MKKREDCIEMVIDEILAQNERFVQQNPLPVIGHAPRKHMAVVTCMDCRLVKMFEQALGLERGDVLELRTAGATISKLEREGAANDLIRSLAGGIYLLGVREVAVIGHTQCGLAHANPTALTASMQALGVDPQALIEKEELGDLQGLVSWLGAFDDVHVNVREVVNIIRSSPYLPKIPVHGLVINIETGKLEMVDRG
jgi:carbonic anhydrase